MRSRLILAFVLVLCGVPAVVTAQTDTEDKHGRRTADQSGDGNVTLTVGTDGSVSQPAPKGGRLDCSRHRHAPSFETPTDNPPLGGDELVEDARGLFVAGRIVLSKRRRGRPPKTPRPGDTLPEVEVPEAYRPLVAQGV